MDMGGYVWVVMCVVVMGVVVMCSVWWLYGWLWVWVVMCVVVMGVVVMGEV